MTNLIRRGSILLLALGGVVCFLVVLNQLSGELTLIDFNRHKGIEVDAYFYSELGDLTEFLDEKNGKYGKRALEGCRQSPNRSHLEAQDEIE